MPLPPRAVTISAVSWIVSGRFFMPGLPETLRPVQYTVAPASPSAVAMPRPAPRVAPATTATFPASDLSMPRPTTRDDSRSQPGPDVDRRGQGLVHRALVSDFE